MSTEKNTDFTKDITNGGLPYRKYYLRKRIIISWPVTVTFMLGNLRCKIGWGKMNFCAKRNKIPCYLRLSLTKTEK